MLGSVHLNENAHLFFEIYVILQLNSFCSDLTPEQIAGVLSCFVAEKSSSKEAPKLAPDMEAALKTLRVSPPPLSSSSSIDPPSLSYAVGFPALATITCSLLSSFKLG